MANWLHAEACEDSSPSSLALTSEMFSDVCLEACRPARDKASQQNQACKAVYWVSCDSSSASEALTSIR